MRALVALGFVIAFVAGFGAAQFGNAVVRAQPGGAANGQEAMTVYQYKTVSGVSQDSRSPGAIMDQINQQEVSAGWQVFQAYPVQIGQQCDGSGPNMSGAAFLGRCTSTYVWYFLLRRPQP